MVARTRALTSGDGMKWSDSRSLLKASGICLWMDCIWSIKSKRNPRCLDNLKD